MNLKLELEVAVAPEYESGCTYCAFRKTYECPEVLTNVCNLNDRFFFKEEDNEIQSKR